MKPSFLSEDYKPSSRWYGVVIVIVLLAVIGIFTLGVTYLADLPSGPFSIHRPAKYSCIAGPDEQCASDLWIADYQHLKSLTDKYKMPTELQDQVTGMAMRLNQQVPQGYRWDEAKLRFVRIAQPAPAPPPEPIKK